MGNKQASAQYIHTGLSFAVSWRVHHVTFSDWGSIACCFGSDSGNILLKFAYKNTLHTKILFKKSVFSSESESMH